MAVADKNDVEFPGFDHSGKFSNSLSNGQLSGLVIPVDWND
jgi:hypothetical protein